MRVFRSLDTYKAGPFPVVTIGTFDGLHIGHRQILKRIIDEAKSKGGESVLLSFYPHPRLVIFPENNDLRLLQTLDEKIEILERMGLDKLVLIDFTREFSRTTSKAFVQSLLVEKIKAKKIIIGYDHRFGRNRTGGIEILQKYQEEFGYEIEEIPAQMVKDAKVSSTKIRAALEAGDIATTNEYLGYPYLLSGIVVQGAQQGRLLGFPTANIEPGNEVKLIPPHGVYLVRVGWDGPPLPPDADTDNSSVGKLFQYYGLLSYGNKPAFGRGGMPTLEVHILDFDDDLYGKRIRVGLLEFIRGQLDFGGSLDKLIRAIRNDETYARRLIAEKYED